MKSFRIDEPVLDVSVHLLTYWVEQVFRNTIYTNRAFVVERDSHGDLIVRKKDEEKKTGIAAINEMRETVVTQMTKVIRAAYGSLGDDAYLDRVVACLERVTAIEVFEDVPTAMYEMRNRFLPNQIALHPRMFPARVENEDDKTFVAAHLVADDALFGATNRMSVALGPVIWEYVRLVLLHYNPSLDSRSAFDLESFLRYVSAAFTVCVCGGRGLEFLHALQTIRDKIPLWVHFSCGALKPGPSPYAPWALLNCMHEKVKFTPIRLNSSSDFRNYLFGARIDALLDSTSFFDPSEAGLNDEAGLMLLRMYVPSLGSVALERLLNKYTYGVELNDTWYRMRHFAQLNYLMEISAILTQYREVTKSKVVIPDMSTVMKIFVKSTDLLDDDDFESVTLYGREYVARSGVGDRYVLHDATLQYLYLGIGSDRSDEDTAERAELLVERVERELGIDPEWTVSFLLWWA